MEENYEDCEGICRLKRFLFGKLKRKINVILWLLLLFTLSFILVNYNLSRQIQGDQNYLREIKAPLDLMVQQVIGYDAELTSAAYESLLHVEEGNFDRFNYHKKIYDEIGFKLDNILKIDAPSLINKSGRTPEEMQKVLYYLSELDRINLLLVDLEVRAFSALEKKDTLAARNLIVANQYELYKEQLAFYYDKWAAEEARISERYRKEIILNSNRISLYNWALALLLILFVFFLPFFADSQIVRPIKKLTEATKEIEKGNFDANVNLKTGDEIEELADVFNRTAKILKNTDDERKQIDRAKTEFMSITSHELRSPMTPMKAQLQMVLGNYFGKLNKQQRESLEIVLRNTERLDKIIVDFLEISRIEAARLKFNFIKVNLSPYVKRLKEEMDAFLAEKSIEIELKVGKLPVFEVDPDRVMQVLRNLINNAKKFSKDNSKIIIEVEYKGKMIEFSVKDSGVGIRKDSQAWIFEPFYQVDNMYQHQSGGTGLGLAICKGIVESQNGRIWFKSQEGIGTTFYFTVPLIPVREIKPIRVLFSSNKDIEKKIKNIFIEILGPLGENEFEEFKIMGLVEEDLIAYVETLKANGIIQHTEEFKNKIKLIFGDKKEAKR
jgi:signal transduction histidine kinase